VLKNNAGQALFYMVARQEHDVKRFLGAADVFFAVGKPFQTALKMVK